jgi:hypothetical protein
LRKLICSAVLAACLPAVAAAQGSVTVFGGYTYLRAAHDTGSGFNLNGWDASLEGKSFYGSAGWRMSASSTARPVE